MGPDAHRIGELRSLAYHRAVAERLGADPILIERAQNQVTRAIARGGRALPYHRRWQSLLNGARDELLAVLTTDDEQCRALRQCTPFAGALPARERWALWRRVRAQAEAGL